MIAAVVFDFAPLRSGCRRYWRHIHVIALIVAFALVVSPLGMVGMGEAHAQTMGGMETTAMPHCPSQDDEHDLNQFDSAADCRAACAALAIQLLPLQIQMGGKIEIPYPNLATAPHEQLLGSDPPPPRFS